MENTRYTAGTLIYIPIDVFSAFDQELLSNHVVIGDIGKSKWSISIAVIGGIGYAILLLAWYNKG